MEKGKRIEAINAEIPLPEGIIQHIQSLLSGKQAAQTSILSKSWYNAWLTSPNLHLDERNFQKRGGESPTSQIADGFSEFAKKTMQRYQTLNLKIEKFSLWMKSNEGDRNSLASELIVKAVKMSVNDLKFEFHPPTETFVLPREVLGAETLIGLSVIGCKIDRPVDGKVSCSGLKSLILRRVYIGDDVVWDIISSCPLIEKLLLSECECLIDIKDSTVARRMSKVLSLRSPTIEQNVGSVVDRPIKLSEFQNLKSLFLEKIHIDRLYFRDFTLKFPCLEDLTLWCCYGYSGINISSPSLQCISLAQTRTFKATFDVPSIRKFKLSGSSFPNLSFTPLSREWVSEISIKCSCFLLSASWLLKLGKFLTKLSPSKISLSIVFFLEMKIDNVGDIQDLPKPVVENLMLSIHSSSSVCSALLDGLFWSCRPRVITQYWFPRSYIAEKANNELLELLCKTLIRQERENCCIPNQNIISLRDLEEVNVEIFEETLGVWRCLLWETLLDASSSPEARRKIRFQLRWREERITSI
ncbi:hypothetical protein DH2020_035841 [Rehmannia glutinosa]|uniref:F-box/LRR-repeat protein 15/At3g58940/PEG3-like LRR domain-containing protein n=1 Tax=Rehmannia glutinosa TaxID=99300 RepID=A0ABR0V658_REHGL